MIKRRNQTFSFPSFPYLAYITYQLVITYFHCADKTTCTATVTDLTGCHTCKRKMDLLSVLFVSASLLGSYTYAEPTCPQWPKSYVVSGMLRLPYAEINEPFTGYFDSKTNRSRVDYYDGSVVTVQTGWSSKSPKDNGRLFKVAPVFMNNKNTRMCFLTNGTKADPIQPQSVLPDLKGFKNVGIASKFGKKCNIWQKVETIGMKKNTYTMWLTSDGQKPVRYEMMGENTLLGSHYDKYYVDYTALTSTSLSDGIFNVNRTDCGDFPGPGAMDSRLTMNPMAEFINHDDSNTDTSFEDFKNKHHKQYTDEKEHTRRKHVFMQNFRFINSKNRQGLSFSLAVNHLADLTDAERAALRGYRHTTTYDPEAVQSDRIFYDLDSLPRSVDWRLYGAVTPVKDQAVCGSCWSFGTAEAVEGAYFVKTGRLLKLSPQELMDCTWDQGNNGCDGGEDFRAYQWIKKHGIATEDSYGPYMAQDGYCHYWNASERVNISSYVNITSNNQQALKAALFENGPASVAIDASQKSFSFYSSGVYYDEGCGNTPDRLDHAVLAVGYGDMMGQAYWIVKNSWSTYWGNDGYVMMSMHLNNCGVETSPTRVVI